MKSFLFAFALLSALPSFGADSFLASPVKAPSLTSWKLSVVTLAAANTADVVTSLQCNGRAGLVETNGLYGHQFGASAVGIKAGIVGVQVIGQYLLVRRHPKLGKYFAVLNGGESIAPLVAARHNAGLLNGR